MSKKPYRSAQTTEGHRMAGARSLWRATGLGNEDFNKPIIAIANSFSQFVPGHVHLQNYGQMMKRMIAQEGAVGVEFDTIAICDGIAMGHEGMLYSLPSRELVADSVEYMVNAHVADALVCISNCDKITPGMLMAAARLNIPTVFISGGPMQSGKVTSSKGTQHLDLIDAMVMAVDPNVSKKKMNEVEKNACPSCGSCAGMFTANSMNCLTEAIGMGLPGNGTLLATHKLRKNLFEQAAKRIVKMTKAHYKEEETGVLPRSIMSREAFENAMTVDIAMGGSTNTVLHLLALAHAAGVEFSMEDIDRLSRETPCICKVAPSSKYHIEDVNRAGGISTIMGELYRNNKIYGDCATVSGEPLKTQLEHQDIRGRSRKLKYAAKERAFAAPGEGSAEGFSQDAMFPTLDTDPAKGVIRDFENAHSEDGGLCVLYGNVAPDGCIVKTAGVDESILTFTGTAHVFDSQEQAVDFILGDDISGGDIIVIRYEGPRGGPGMQEMLYPTSYLKSRHLDKECALITDGRFSGGTSGLSIGHISPEAAQGGNLAIMKDGDTINIDIPQRSIGLDITDNELNKRWEKIRKSGTGYPTPQRDRNVPDSLKAYGLLATSAARGAVRDVTQNF